MSNIFDKIWNALKDLLPFLSSAAEKTFDQLEDSVKADGINGSLFAQIIKENTRAAASDVRNLIKAKLGLSTEQLSVLENEISSRYKLPSEDDAIAYLQSEFAKYTDDILHSSFANEVAALASIILSKGKLTWVTLLMGVGEYIYRRYVKGQSVALDASPPVCPKGQVWNPITQTCQDPIGKK